MSTDSASVQDQPTIFGHPTGLFMLFFAEMWERFSYYGMRALLVLYMIKGFLSFNDADAYTVYGAYTALVYMTPFFGGLIADRLLGARRAVVIGGLLMAAGHLVMGFDPGVIGWFMGMDEAAVASATGLRSMGEMAFFTALALLIVGNGFFKPNISSIVGTLYPDGDPRRDGGFTLFYMGINLGAAAAPLLCGLIGETFGWHYGFGLATVGMLIGLAVFVLPAGIARFLTLGGALITAASMVLIQDNVLMAGVNGFVALCLAIAGVVAFMAMGRAGLPAEAGGAPNPELLKRGVLGPITLEHLTYVGAVLIVPALAVLVWSNLNIEIVDGDYIDSLTKTGSTGAVLAGTLLKEVSRPAGLILLIIGIGAIGYLIFEAVRAEIIERHRLFVVLILMFFSMLFWAFFEQAGSSVNNFTDRNVDRVFEEQQITASQVGTEVTFKLTQEQLGYSNPVAGKVFTMDQLDALREASNKGPEGEATATVMERLADAFSKPPPLYYALFGGAKADRADDPLTQTWTIDKSHVGMGIGGAEVPASTFQAANPIYILLFGLPFAGLWVWMGRRAIEPNTSVKFALGLLQLGLGFAALWYGAITASDRGMVWMGYLLIGYLLHTTGELCLSPVGLSMVTRLSPKRLVSTVMGGWFLATAFSAYLAAVIASFTGVGSHGGEAKDEDDSDGSADVDTDGGAVPANAETPPEAPPDPVVATDGSDGSDATDDTDGVADATDNTDATDDTDGASDATDDTDALADASDATDDTDGATDAAASTQAADTTEADTEEDGGEEALVATVQAKDPVPPPIETVQTYGGVFGTIAIAAVVSAVLLAAISPLLQKWMHEDLFRKEVGGDDD